MILKFKQFNDTNKKVKESIDSRKIVLFEDYEDEEEENEDEDEEDEEEEDGELDLGEIVWKMDKYMPEDSESQQEYHTILDDDKLSREEKISELESFFQNNADEERLFSYLGKNRTITDLVTYIVDNES